MSANTAVCTAFDNNRAVIELSQGAAACVTICNMLRCFTEHLLFPTALNQPVSCLRLCPLCPLTLKVVINEALQTLITASWLLLELAPICLAHGWFCNPCVRSCCAAARTLQKTVVKLKPAPLRASVEGGAAVRLQSGGYKTGLSTIVDLSETVTF